MIIYMDCTVKSGLQFYCWFGVEPRKVLVECTCQEFQVRLINTEVCRFINAEFTVRMNPFSVATGLDLSWENYAPYTKIIVLNFTGGLVVSFQRFMSLELLFSCSQHKVTSFDRRHADSEWVGLTDL